MITNHVFYHSIIYLENPVFTRAAYLRERSLCLIQLITSIMERRCPLILSSVPIAGLIKQVEHLRVLPPRRNHYREYGAGKDLYLFLWCIQKMYHDCFMNIRQAVFNNTAIVAEIYNWYLENAIISFGVAAVSVEEMTARIQGTLY